MVRKETYGFPGRIVFGVGCIAHLADEIRALGGTKVGLITDKGVAGAGLVTKVVDVLHDANMPCFVFDAVTPDPGLDVVSAAVKACKEQHVDMVLGLGGGSPLDVAKMVSVMAVHGGEPRDYLGIGRVPGPGLPHMLVPTTAGTGSEVTCIAILSDDENALKSGVVSPHLYARVALLDPELTTGLPPSVTAASGLDALIHALEAFTSRNATPLSDLWAQEALRLMAQNLRTAYANGADIAAREATMRGSMLAGMAFAVAGCAAIHAFAYPIGAVYHIPHGMANSIMLPHVFRFNQTANLERHAHLATLLGEPVDGLSLREASAKALAALTQLMEDVGVTQRLRDFGVAEDNVPELAKGVMQAERLLANNPRTLTLADAEAIYRAAL